ncbi:hypothetical protein D3C76_1781180 [compost metagenome]
MSGNQIDARQPGGVEIDLLHQRLRRAGNQPDIGVVGVKILRQAILNHRKRGDMPAKPVDEILHKLVEPRVAMTKGATPQ